MYSDLLGSWDGVVGKSFLGATDQITWVYSVILLCADDYKTSYQRAGNLTSVEVGYVPIHSGLFCSVKLVAVQGHVSCGSLVLYQKIL
jgi:hypothetical protein